MVYVMTSSYLSQLRNVEWELFLMYQEDLHIFKPDLEARLWAEVDRLEGLLVCDNG